MTRPHPTRGQGLGVPADDAVGGDHDLVAAEAVEVPTGPVEAAGRHAGGEPGRLPFPVGEDRRRADDEGRAAAVPAGQVQGQDLDGLAQPHVVGQDATHTQVGHLAQPRQAPQLVGPEDGDEPGGWPLLPRGVHGRQPVGQVPQRTLQLHVQRLPVDGQRPAQGGGQRLARRHPSPLQDPSQRPGVGPHPPAPQADHRPPGLGQGPELLFGELLIADRRLPAQLEQRLQREARRRDRGGGGRHDGLQLDRLHQLGRPEHVDPGSGEVLDDRAHQLVHVLVLQAQPGGPGLVEQPADRRPDLRGSAQGEQQPGLGVPEALEDHLRCRPQVEGVDDQAGVPLALQLQDAGEATLLLGRRLEAHGHHRLVRSAAQRSEPGLAGVQVGGRHRREGFVPSQSRGAAGAGKQVGDGIGERRHGPVRRGHPQRTQADQPGVGLGRECRAQLLTPDQVLRVEGTQPPGVRSRRGQAGQEPAPGDQLDRDASHRGPRPHRRTHRLTGG